MFMIGVGQPLWAMPNRVPATVRQSGTGVVIPNTAVEVAPHVFSLGTTRDEASGKIVEGYAFVTPRKSFGHKPNHNPGQGKKPGNGGSGTSKCYAYFAKGAKWKVNEPWVVNPSNTVGVGEQFVFDEMTAGITQWEDAADGTIDGSSVNTFGNGTSTSDVLVADTASPDSKNEVLFGSINSPGAIAVTIVWGIFNGPPQARELVEWDIVYDQDDFLWSEDASVDPNSMDFTNIAVHEIGHAFGMAHPDDACVDETMYRFASEGEISKRDLNSGDIAGIDKLY